MAAALNHFARSYRLPVTAELKSELLKRYDYRCHYCQVDLNHDDVSVDFALPLARGGLMTFNNLRTACAVCHLEKGQRTELEYMLWKFVKYAR